MEKFINLSTKEQVAVNVIMLEKILTDNFDNLANYKEVVFHLIDRIKQTLPDTNKVFLIKQ